MMIDWYDLDKNGNPIKLPNGTFPSGKPGSQFHLKTKVGKYEVSTVFLGLDHGHGSYIPILFETMVFGGGEENKHECIQERYATKKEAEKGHRLVVKKIEGLADLLKKL